MGGLEGFALQEACGFAPGSGSKAARTRCKKETSRGPAAPAPPPGEFASSSMWDREPTRPTFGVADIAGYLRSGEPVYGSNFHSSTQKRISRRILVDSIVLPESATRVL